MNFFCRLISLIALAGSCVLFASAAVNAPSIRSISPPGWWQQTARHSLRLMVTGDHLADVHVTVAPDSFHAGELHASANGHYLFVTIDWMGHPASGPVRLTLENSSGSAHADFAFAPGPRPNPPGFGPDDVIYLIMVDRFAHGASQHTETVAETHRDLPRAYHGGDFPGIEQHLDYLKALGIQAIWMTPVDDNGPQADYHGYGAIDEYKVEEHFGTLQSLRHLIDAAHHDGIKVIQDQVANHTGPANPWVKDRPTPDWYNGSPGDPQINNFDYAAVADSHATPAMTSRTLDGWFGGKLPDLNQRDAEVRQFEIQNAEWWLGMTGIDGIRQDTFPDVPCSFWRDWDASLRREFPHVTIVGEVFDRRAWVTSYFENACMGRYAADDGLTVFDYPLYFALRDVFIRNKPFIEISNVLAQDRLYRHPERLVTFIGDHDVPRFLTAAGGSIPKLKMAFTFLLTMRGEPMIYYGDEIGMTGGQDPDNRHDFPGGFPGDRQNAFAASGRTPEQNDVWTHVHQLLALRQRHPALRQGRLQELVADNQQFAYLRSLPGDAVLVVFNTATQAATISLNMPEVKAHAWVDLTGKARLGKQSTLEIPAESSVILLAK